jgi:catechol 2,3-dioxygenase-like lactoylglutathione lyase family enzyme
VTTVPTSGNKESRKLATISLVVRDYDEAIAWYREKLGFLLIEDVDLGEGRRWVVVAPDLRDGARLLLAEAKNDDELARVGNQTGGRVAFFLETNDFWRDHELMRVRGVQFREEPREESYGTVAVFADLYGNLFDLIEMKRR